MTAQTKLLLRYLDREMSAEEAKGFERSLRDSSELRQELAEMRRVGAFVRSWAASAETRGAELVGPTLVRIRDAERNRRRQTTLGYVLAGALLVVLPWSRHAPELSRQRDEVAKSAGAAIERLEAADTRAQVFLVDGSSTPVVWLVDDAPDDDSSAQRGPG